MAPMWKGHDNVVDDTYIFVWANVHSTPRRYIPPSKMRICSLDQPANEDGTLECTARFNWNSLKAEFTCSYRPSSETFFGFEVQQGSQGGGLQSAVLSYEMDSAGIDGSVTKTEVKDDNGNSFMQVLLAVEEAGQGSSTCTVYGKMAADFSEIWNGLELTSAERSRLGISDSDWERSQ